MEEALHDMPQFRDFAGLYGQDDRLPDERTFLHFPHVQEKNKLTERILAMLNLLLGAKGLPLRSGTVVDATLIALFLGKKLANTNRQPPQQIGANSTNAEIDEPVAHLSSKVPFSQCNILYKSFIIKQGSRSINHIMKKIAVITRTKDRPIFLRRCANDLLEQKFAELCWVIVNDGGDSEPVENTASYARSHGLHCITVHLKENVGVAEAANEGIRHSESEYIHLHDDDDSVEAGFYEIMCKYLDQDIKGRFGGVVCSSNRIDEKIDGTQIQQISKHPLHHSRSATHIADILTKNQFSTISFVYRRSCLETIGCYDTNLSVLEDWDFNIRFLMRFDIASIYSNLANYHFRSNTTGSLSQTVQNSMQHEIFAAVLRNNHFRAGIASLGDAMPGLVMTVGRNFQIQQGRLHEIQDHLRAEWTVKGVLKRITHRIRSL